MEEERASMEQVTQALRGPCEGGAFLLTWETYAGVLSRAISYLILHFYCIERRPHRSSSRSRKQRL